MDPQQTSIPLDGTIWTSEQATAATREDITSYIQLQLSSYDQENLYGRDLYDNWISDFANFTISTYKKTTDATRNLRDYLRQRNVYVPKAKGPVTAQKLIEAAAAKYSPMPEDLQHDVLIQYRTAMLPQIQHLEPQQQQLNNSFGSMTLEKSNHKFTTLWKSYPDDQKYEGTLVDSLDLKFSIFEDHCETCGIPENLRNRAFKYMLKGQALSEYYTVICKADPLPPLSTLLEKLRERFEGPEHQQQMLNRWTELTIQKIVDRDGVTDLEVALQTLVRELRQIQPMLEPGLRDNESILRTKILMACRGHPACSYACADPPKTTAALINKLSSSINTWKAVNTTSPASASQYATETDDHEEGFFVDRKYYGGNQRNQQLRGRYAYRYHGRRGPGNHTGSTARYNNNNRQNYKSCYVCNKENCWSRNHTEDERQAARKSFRERRERHGRQYLSESDLNHEILQYIQFCEGDQEEDQALQQINDFESFLSSMPESSLKEESEQFLTACGPITNHQACSITQKLAENAAAHALTSTIDNAETTNTDDVDSTYLIGDRWDSSVFQGIVIDTGAAVYSTAGHKQVEAYNTSFDRVCLDLTKKVSIKFGIGTTISLGTITIWTPVGHLTFHVVPVVTPFLLCINDMDEHNIYLNNISNYLCFQGTEKRVPVIRRFGHALLQWGPIVTGATSYLSEAELRTLHRRFGHPSAQRLMNLLDKAGHHDPKHRKALESITKLCNNCQRHGSAPLRFKFTLKDDNITFNHTIYVDIMYIDGNPVLHIVDEATRFQAARWLPSMASQTVWEALRLAWIDIYLGPPDIIRHDAGTNLTSAEFQQHAIALGINTNEAPVEAANTMGLVERYHKPLRRAYEVIKEDLGPSVSNKAAVLQMAVKAVNDTMGPDGLVPTLLVFGTYPRMVNDKLIPSATIMDRARAINKAMAEVSKIRAQHQVKDAIQTRNGPLIEAIPLGSNVLVWRQHAKEWEGPFKLLSQADGRAIIQLPSGPTTFRASHVKMYTADSTDRKNDIVINSEPSQNVETPIAPEKDYIRERHQRQRRLPSRYRDAEKPELTTFLMEIQPDFTASRQKELEGLLQREVFQIVNIEDLPPGTRLFNSRFVDVIKLKGTPQAYEKSRLVVQAYKDTEKRTVLTQSPTVQRVSQRLLLSIAVTKRLEVYLRDISQAYTQSATRLTRDFYVNAPPELDLPTDMVLKVLLPLYGVPEAGTHWFRTYHDHHTQRLGLQQSAADPCLLYRKDPVAVVALQTDDTLFTCTEDYRRKEETELKAAAFTAKPVQKLTVDEDLNFNGLKLKLNASGTVTITQANHCQNISQANTKAGYIAQRARGAYVATMCQPQASFDLAMAAQTPDPQRDDFRALNKRLEWQIQNKQTGLTFVPLDEATMKIIVFTDASFANNKDMSSQLGYVLVLADGTGACNLLQWSSIKCKRVTRSVLASELYAMVNGFDAGCVLKHTIDGITGKQIPLTICIDSFSLYECLVKLGTTKEKRLMIDINAIRQAYERREIAEIIWIKGSSNPADSMTKSSSNNALEAIIAYNRVEVQPEAWVERH